MSFTLTMSPRVMLGIVGLVSVGVVAAGCAATPTAGTGWQSAADTREDYYAATASYQLPPGAEWPYPAYRTESEDGAVMAYDSIRGQVDADIQWYCAWGRVALDPATSSGDRAAAITEVNKVLETTFFRYGIAESDRAWWKSHVIDPIAEGDMSGLETDVSLNCGIG